MFKLVVLFSVLALAATSPSGLAPWGLGLAAPLVGAVHAPVAAPVPIAPGVLRPYNYRGPISLAPGQPANILATDGRPLDTLSVNLDRAAHLTARAVDHAAPLAAAWSHSAGLVAPAHLGLGAPLAPWGLGPLGHGLPLVHG